MDTLIERAKKLQEENVFLGGAPELFEIAGRKQLIALLSEGLNPGSKVLDIGCGCLRAGYWLIHFLKPGCYFGIEPNREMLDAGIRIVLDPGLMDLKKPRFDGNAAFDFSVFGEKFDCCVARSIWSHASKPQIETMLDGFRDHSNPEAVFLTSYLRSSLLRRDYKGDDWVGKSHESDTPGEVRHSLAWIQKECGNRGLFADEIKNEVFDFGNQTWLRIQHKNR